MSAPRGCGRPAPGASPPRRCPDAHRRAIHSPRPPPPHRLRPQPPRPDNHRPTPRPPRAGPPPLLEPRASSGLRAAVCRAASNRSDVSDLCRSRPEQTPSSSMDSMDSAFIVYRSVHHGALDLDALEVNWPIIHTVHAGRLASASRFSTFTRTPLLISLIRNILKKDLQFQRSLDPPLQLAVPTRVRVELLFST